jgi:hypothetical protein
MKEKKEEKRKKEEERSLILRWRLKQLIKDGVLNST